MSFWSKQRFSHKSSVETKVFCACNKCRAFDSPMDDSYQQYMTIRRNGRDIMRNKSLWLVSPTTWNLIYALFGLQFLSKRKLREEKAINALSFTLWSVRFRDRFDFYSFNVVSLKKSFNKFYFRKKNCFFFLDLWISVGVKKEPNRNGLRTIKLFKIICLSSQGYFYSRSFISEPS